MDRVLTENPPPASGIEVEGRGFQGVAGGDQNQRSYTFRTGTVNSQLLSSRRYDITHTLYIYIYIHILDMTSRDTTLYYIYINAGQVPGKKNTTVMHSGHSWLQYSDVCLFKSSLGGSYIHTHIYIYVCVCVCVCDI